MTQPEEPPRLKDKGVIGRWSDVVRAIEADGGPVTPHPDAETLRRLARVEQRKRMASEFSVSRVDPRIMDVDDELPAPIPARPYSLPVVPFHRRLWNVLTRRAA